MNALRSSRMTFWRTTGQFVKWAPRNFTNPGCQVSAQVIIASLRARKREGLIRQHGRLCEGTPLNHGLQCFPLIEGRVHSTHCIKIIEQRMRIIRLVNPIFSCVVSRRPCRKVILVRCWLIASLAEHPRLLGVGMRELPGMSLATVSSPAQRRDPIHGHSNRGTSLKGRRGPSEHLCNLQWA
jgi:hypothetical protein